MRQVTTFWPFDIVGLSLGLPVFFCPERPALLATWHVLVPLFPTSVQSILIFFTQWHNSFSDYMSYLSFSDFMSCLFFLISCNASISDYMSYLTFWLPVHVTPLFLMTYTIYFCLSIWYISVIDFMPFLSFWLHAIPLFLTTCHTSLSDYTYLASLSYCTCQTCLCDYMSHFTFWLHVTPLFLTIYLPLS